MEELTALLIKQHDELIQKLDGLQSLVQREPDSPSPSPMHEKSRESVKPDLQRMVSPDFQRLDSYEVATLKTEGILETMGRRLSTPETEKTVWNASQRFADKILGSYWATIFFAMAILSNSIFLGVQLQWRVHHPQETSETFALIHILYAVLFTMEVLLRYASEGFADYICGSGWKWNWLDVFVVVSSWVEIMIDILTPGTSTSLSNTNLRLVRILRMGRLLRVVRVIRVVRIFKALRTLVHSLVDTTKSLIWAMLLLVLIIYIFSILFTDVVLDHIEETGSSDEGLRGYFGNIYYSAATLFRALLNGFSWMHAADSLLPVGMFWVQLFHFYMAFCTFAVLNVMTGVFCNSAIKAAEKDHELVVQSLLQNRQDFRALVSNLFRRMDERGLGKITLKDLEKHMEDEAVKAFFESLEIGAVDAWTLFMSLDVNGDYIISVEEFMERCIQLRGPARSADLYALKQQGARMRREMQQLQESQLRTEDYLRTLAVFPPAAVASL